MKYERFFQFEVATFKINYAFFVQFTKQNCKTDDTSEWHFVLLYRLNSIEMLVCASATTTAINMNPQTFSMFK